MKHYYETAGDLGNSRRTRDALTILPRLEASCSWRARAQARNRAFAIRAEKSKSIATVVFESNVGSHEHLEVRGRKIFIFR